MKYKVVTICGSMRFYQEMLSQAARLTREGCIVLMPFADKRDIETKDEVQHRVREEMLDAMHRVKIDMCEEILVIDGDKDENYHLGFSTKKEIEYALAQQKKVTYYSLLDIDIPVRKGYHARIYREDYKVQHL